MKRIFIDSSVLFAAAYSASGYSRDLILMAARQEITLALSPLILEETRRNLAESAPEAVAWLDLLTDAIPFEFVRPGKEEIVEASKHVASKDAPIIAVAKVAQMELLATLDKKHLFGKPDLTDYAGVKIVAPKEAVTILRSVN